MWNTLKGKWKRLPSVLRTYITSIVVISVVVFYFAVLAAFLCTASPLLAVTWLILGVALLVTLFAEYT